MPQGTVPEEIEVSLPGRAGRVSLQLLVTGKGDELSWLGFHKKRFNYAGYFEKKLGLTVHLSDTITEILTTAKAIDPKCTISIEWVKGFLFPEFSLHITSTKFTLEVSKRFAGGSSRESPYNYRISMDAYSVFQEYTDLIASTCRRRRLP